MYPQLDLHVNNFLQKYEDTANFTVLSVENRFSIPPTLFFLSKISARFKNYKFVDAAVDMWKEVSAPSVWLEYSHGRAWTRHCCFAVGAQQVPGLRLRPVRG